MKNSQISAQYESLKVHPIFEPIKKLLEFYILGIGFIGQPDFQRIFLETNPGLKYLVDRYNIEVNLRKDGPSVKSETKTYLISLGQIMAIALFNILEFSKYQNDLSGEETFKFAKHLRNGAAHNNKFNIAPPLGKPVQWKNKIIDNSLQGTPVFLDFISPVT